MFLIMLKNLHIFCANFCPYEKMFSHVVSQILKILSSSKLWVWSHTVTVVLEFRGNLVRIPPSLLPASAVDFGKHQEPKGPSLLSLETVSLGSTSVTQAMKPAFRPFYFLAPCLSDGWFLSLRKSILLLFLSWWLFRPLQSSLG